MSFVVCCSLLDIPVSPYPVLHHFLWSFFFFFNDTATTEIYTLFLHDALPISAATCARPWRICWRPTASGLEGCSTPARSRRSEEHTSELQSQSNLVCRLL